MNKLWKPTEPKPDKLIFISNNYLYKGNPSFQELNTINIETKNIQNVSGMFGTPYSYIKSIENQKGKNFLKINLGKNDEEKIKIYNEELKDEIFNFFF